jgi:3-dehydroquinate synthase
MKLLAPGSFQPCVDRWGRFEELLPSLEGPAIAIADERVLRLHPHVARALQRLPKLVALRAGEGAKSLRTLERLAAAAVEVPRRSTVLAVGGGSIGDVAAVFAHLHKRGARLIQVPTTWLAAVDSSLGGKGAVNVAGLKNGLGVFHAPVEGWLCPELFTTLSPAQLREGHAEAFKMALTLDERTWRTWRLAKPDASSLIRTSRELKTRVCVKDPYEQRGLREVFNFGHTFAHVVESVSHYRVRHGEAVALGMVCALDLGRAVGVTPDAVAADVEPHLPMADRARRRLASVLAKVPAAEVSHLLLGDKKGATKTHTRFILLERPGRWLAQEVPNRAWVRLLPAWRKGLRP